VSTLHDTTRLRKQTDEYRVLTALLFLVSRMVLAAYEATTRWTLKADLAVSEPQFSAKRIVGTVQFGPDEP
jgi:hypothetical protein